MKAGLCYLIAEDHEFQRMHLARLLASIGARCIYEVGDGNAALDIVRDPARPVDVIITDLDMPGMDGMELIRHLGESGVPVNLILASSLDRKLLASVETMTEAFGIKLLGVIEKPLTLAKLRPLLDSYVPPAPTTQPPTAAARHNYTLEEVTVALDAGEIEPFFQPKVEMATGRVVGAEALARWRHPRDGIVAPFAFIRLLEDHDAIDSLTWVMLRTAAAACNSWRKAGLPLTVGVNLSLKSLGDTRLAERVTELVRHEDLDPRHLVLEVTESAATTDVGKALENLARLRMKGFGLSIDDFGTGYSSMQQLTRIAFTELKIDQSFVMHAARQESARVILESSLDMSKKLGLVAVAEGVETQADWNLLRELGCGMAQGYFVARPMEGAMFPKWVRGWAAGESLH
ncbi:MAG: EAL domain-containing response regulator [Usitatibacter sp.]